MEIGTAFFLGFLGSLHCAGMCGPLVMALPGGDQRPFTRLRGRVAYNLGRIFTYGLFGVVFGFMGKSLALAGLQRGISIGAGMAILIAVATARRIHWSGPVNRAMPWIKKQFAARLKNGTVPSLSVLGALNGLLPCGLVYVAAAAAASTGGLIPAVTFMILFGVGTIPMMLGAAFLGRNLQASIRLRFQRMIPAALIVVGAMLVLRGLALGIPILSPDIEGDHGDCDSCHATLSGLAP